MLECKNVPLRGGRTARVYKAGQGPTLVWLHGPHGIRHRDPFFAKLAERYSAIAPLSPGFADLDELNEIDNVHDLALHYDDLFDALGLDGLTLVGHSFGAMAAAEYAAHYPRRVRKLVLISPIGLWRDDCPLPDMFGVPYQRIDTLLWKSGEASPQMADPADDPNDPVEKQVALVQAMTTVAKFIWPLPDRRLRRRLPRISADTLVIAGAEDAFVPPVYLDDFTAAIPRARSLAIAGAAHMTPYEREDDVLRAVDAHIGVALGRV